RAACAGDCDANGEVTIDEIVSMVNILLGDSAFSVCPAGDANNSGDIEINEVIIALNNLLLNGCAGGAPVCGNGVVDGPSGGLSAEECDIGGVCVGTAAAGQLCTSDADCGAGPGRCRGGTKAYRTCNANGDCGGGKCVRCETFGGEIPGGNGTICAANCTF